MVQAPPYVLPTSAFWGATCAFYLSSRKWIPGAPKAQYIYRTRPSASAPCCMGGIQSTRFQTTAPVAITRLPNAIASTGPSVRPSRGGFLGRPRRNLSIEPGHALAPPCRTVGIRSTRFQTTAPVAITCLPNAIVGTGSPVRPPHTGLCGRNA